MHLIGIGCTLLHNFEDSSIKKLMYDNNSDIPIQNDCNYFMLDKFVLM